MQILEKAAETGQTGRIRCVPTRFGGADGAILRERGCFARERQVQGAEKCGTIKLQGGSVAMELRIAIVEDQKFEAQRLERLLRQAWGDPVVCDLYESGDAFLHRAAAGPYAVVFLDICMEGTNGIGTARQLREKDPHLLIVFVTSSPEYVWEAFPVHPFDYLLKPYSSRIKRKRSGS